MNFYIHGEVQEGTHGVGVGGRDGECFTFFFERR